MYRFNPYAIPWAVIAVVLFVLAAVIMARQRASRVAVLFCLMIVPVAVWFGGFTGMLSATTEDAAIPWARLALTAVCFLPAAIYDFTATALRLYSARRRLIIAAWAIATLFALLAASTYGFVARVVEHPWGFYPRAGWLVPLFLLFLFGVLVTQVIEGLGERRRTEDATRRRRIAKLMLSFLVVYVATVDFLPMFGANMRPISFIPVLGFMLTAWGAIRRHRFVPITAARAAREIVGTMADALFVIDAEGRIRVVNEAVRSLFGYTGADLIGRSIDTLEELDGDQTISRTLRDLAHRGPIRDQERVLRGKSGEAVAVSVSISPVSEREEQEGAVVIARDIRERKRAEEELRSALTRLEQSNRELEDFAYVASHDLQEPLRKIQAFGDLLQSKHAAALPDQARDYIERMQSAAKRMQVLINDLLSFSRVTTKAQPFVRVDLHEIAREVAKDLEVRGAITIGELPVIEADPLQMRQLLQNLAGNGLKFHRDGVVPRVEIAGAVENGRCRISVRDNGIGFEQKYADRIFTMFERLHARSKYEGTGIGLAICRKIAERHGGDIHAHSVPGEGSVFEVVLPVRR